VKSGADAVQLTPEAKKYPTKRALSSDITHCLEKPPPKKHTFGVVFGVNSEPLPAVELDE
jgi:hypothetical protein